MNGRRVIVPIGGSNNLQKPAERDCDPYVLHQDLAALLKKRAEDGWRLEGTFACEASTDENLPQGQRDRVTCLWQKV